MAYRLDMLSAGVTAVASVCLRLSMMPAFVALSIAVAFSAGNIMMKSAIKARMKCFGMLNTMFLLFTTKVQFLESMGKKKVLNSFRQRDEDLSH